MMDRKRTGLFCAGPCGEQDHGKPADQFDTNLMRKTVKLFDCFALCRKLHAGKMLLLQIKRFIIDGTELAEAFSHDSVGHLISPGK